MPIIYHSESSAFHLYNSKTSYIFRILPEGYPVHLYYGKTVHDQSDFDCFFEKEARSMSVTFDLSQPDLSLEHLKLEYPVFGTGDMRMPALDAEAQNGSRLLELKYQKHEIIHGKPSLPGLPAVYTEQDEEADTLLVYLLDEKTGLSVVLSYTVMYFQPALIRSVKITNTGNEKIILRTACSLSLDLPDASYDMIELSGAWARERKVVRTPLCEGTRSIGSLRGHSGNNFNPFIALCRGNCTETEGEVIGFSLVYSGNFLAETITDTYDTVRVRLGIHPHTFSWQLCPGESFFTPEAVMVYASQGLNEMSGIYHKLYRCRLARGYWRDQTRPILVNNWEGTYFDFDEEKLLSIAKEAKELGIEMFVLDDGWFINRNSDHTGLGDWIVDDTKFPLGLKHFADTVREYGLQFGIWIEPEMVSPGTELIGTHPDWVIHEPGRPMHPGRNQFVLDFSNPDVVSTVFDKLDAVFSQIRPDYVKWDMNRSISDIYSPVLKNQGELMHRYILGVYSLYEKLTEKCPRTLFESCSSGGARFDPGLLYYAPQCWTSDNTDAFMRQRIQYGTSFVYPLSSMGSHVSAVPNHMTGHITPLSTRANTAYFGTFGYELDLTKMTEEEKEEVKAQVRFMKQHRQLIQFGTFLRLRSPFETDETIWMVVSEDRKDAIVGYYRFTKGINERFRRVRLAGLNPDDLYHVSLLEKDLYGDVLMNAGLILSDTSFKDSVKETGDYISRLYLLHAE